MLLFSWYRLMASAALLPSILIRSLRAQEGQGLIVWTALLWATASPAPSVMVSLRLKYCSCSWSNQHQMTHGSRSQRIAAPLLLRQSIDHPPCWNDGYCPTTGFKYVPVGCDKVLVDLLVALQK